MKEDRLREIFEGVKRISLLVVGDFFLDQYWVVDPAIREISVETGLEAFQVRERRVGPGAAGTVASNLAALGVGKIRVIGILGRDGTGFDLLTALANRGIDTSTLIQSRERVTPSYVKPMMLQADGTEREMQRFDIRNRTPTSAPLEDAVLMHLVNLLDDVDGVILADQVAEPDCGVITRRIREELSRIALARPDKPFIADSRRWIGQFHSVMIKPNEAEARRAVQDEDLPLEKILGTLYERTQRPVILTRGPGGLSLYDGQQMVHLPAHPVEGPFDIVGAGDSLTAGLMSAFCAGANLTEAAKIGNLAASVTIHKVGTTGTASPEEILARAQSVPRCQDAG